MSENKRSIPCDLIGGILFAILAIYRLPNLISGFSFWNLLYIAAYGYLAVVLLLRQRSFLPAIGFGVLALLALRTLFLGMAGRFLLLLILLLERLLLVAAYAAATLLALAGLTDWLPGLKRAAAKLWFLPAGCLVASFLAYALYSFFNLFMGLPFGVMLQILLSSLLDMGLQTACLFFAGAWVASPSGMPAIPRSSAPSSASAAPAGGYAPAGAPRSAAADGAALDSAYCGMAKHVLLLLFTFGVWQFIWIYRTTRELNRVADEPPRNPTTKLLLCLFVPFYSIYWYYKSAQRVDKLALAQGETTSIASATVWLAIFGGIVAPVLIQRYLNDLVTQQGGGPRPAQAPVQPPVQPAQPPVQQAAPGQQAAPVQQPAQQQAPVPPAPQPPVPPAAPVQPEIPVQQAAGTAEMIRQYKELLDCGAITQEEYDQMKRKLLGL